MGKVLLLLDHPSYLDIFIYDLYCNCIYMEKRPFQKTESIVKIMSKQEYMLNMSFLFSIR